MPPAFSPLASPAAPFVSPTLLFPPSWHVQAGPASPALWNPLPPTPPLASDIPPMPSPPTPPQDSLHGRAHATTTTASAASVQAPARSTSTEGSSPQRGDAAAAEAPASALGPRSMSAQASFADTNAQSRTGNSAHRQHPAPAQRRQQQQQLRRRGATDRRSDSPFFLNSSGPYIDPAALERMLHRRSSLALSPPARLGALRSARPSAAAGTSSHPRSAPAGPPAPRSAASVASVRPRITAPPPAPGDLTRSPDAGSAHPTSGVPASGATLPTAPAPASHSPRTTKVAAAVATLATAAAAQALEPAGPPPSFIPPPPAPLPTAQVPSQAQTPPSLPSVASPSTCVGVAPLVARALPSPAVRPPSPSPAAAALPTVVLADTPAVHPVDGGEPALVAANQRADVAGVMCATAPSSATASAPIAKPIAPLAVGLNITASVVGPAPVPALRLSDQSGGNRAPEALAPAAKPATALPAASQTPAPPHMVPAGNPTSLLAEITTATALASQHQSTDSEQCSHPGTHSVGDPAPPTAASGAPPPAAAMPLHASHLGAAHPSPATPVPTRGRGSGEEVATVPVPGHPAPAPHDRGASETEAPALLLVGGRMPPLPPLPPRPAVRSPKPASRTDTTPGAPATLATPKVASTASTPVLVASLQASPPRSASPKVTVAGPQPLEQPASLLSTQVCPRQGDASSCEIVSRTTAPPPLTTHDKVSQRVQEPPSRLPVTSDLVAPPPSSRASPSTASTSAGSDPEAAAPQVHRPPPAPSPPVPRPRPLAQLSACPPSPPAARVSTPPPVSLPFPSSASSPGGYLSPASQKANLTLDSVSVGAATSACSAATRLLSTSPPSVLAHSPASDGAAFAAALPDGTPASQLGQTALLAAPSLALELPEPPQPRPPSQPQTQTQPSPGNGGPPVPPPTPGTLPLLSTVTEATLAAARSAWEASVCSLLSPSSTPVPSLPSPPLRPADAPRPPPPPSHSPAAAAESSAPAKLVNSYADAAAAAIARHSAGVAARPHQSPGDPTVQSHPVGAHHARASSLLSPSRSHPPAPAMPPSPRAVNLRSPEPLTKVHRSPQFTPAPQPAVRRRTPSPQLTSHELLAHRREQSFLEQLEQQRARIPWQQDPAGIPPQPSE